MAKVDSSKPAADEVAEQMRKLGAELMAVADDATARKAKVKEVEQFLGSLKIVDFPELAESQIIQNFVKMFGTEGLTPGQARNRGTLAEVAREWKWDDLRQFPPRTFTPNETIPLTWNGLTVQVYADVECTVPEPFYDLYREHKRWQREAQVHEKYMLGVSDQPPHPSLMTDATAIVRAFSHLGPPNREKQGSLGVGPITLGVEQEEKSG